jgi:hypothetical protein
LVLQYGRPAAVDRRRRRRIAADRPATDAEVVRDIMVLVRFLSARASRGRRCLNRTLVAALRPDDFRSNGSVSGAGAVGVDCPERRGERFCSTEGRHDG